MLARKFGTRMAGRGALIVFEGCDHSGKTTQCRRLVEWLQQEQIPVEPFRFPGKFYQEGGKQDPFAVCLSFSLAPLSLLVNKRFKRP